MASLTFMPIDDISDAWVSILEQALELSEFNPFTKFVDYFVNNWMENETRFTHLCGITIRITVL
jgi:hypothetical protein